MKMPVVFTLMAGALLAAPTLAQQSFNQGANSYPATQQQVQQPVGYPNSQQPAAYPQASYRQDGQSMPSQQIDYPQNPQGGFTGTMPSASGNTGQVDPSAMQAMNQLQAVLQAEMQNFGVPPQAELHQEFHAPTPTSIPGGQVITTDRLLALYQQGEQNGLLVFDVLGAGPNAMLPMAQNAVGAAQPGSFNDSTQQQFGQFLQQTTQGNTSRPMVFYCQGPHCWMSYNAALRAIRLGYTQVYWYRGGVEAWQQVSQMAMSMPQQDQMQMPGGSGQVNYPGGQNAMPNGYER